MSVSYISQNASVLDISKTGPEQTFIAKVTIKNTGKRGYVYRNGLSQVFARFGWEILNPRMVDGEGAFKIFLFFTGI